MGPQRRILFVLSVLLIFSSISFANDIKDSQSHEWMPISAGPATTWPAPVVGKGKLSVQPFFIFNRSRGSFDVEGHLNSLPKGDQKSNLQQQLFAQYGLTDQWEVDGQINYQENNITQADLKAHDKGFADSLLYTRYELFKEQDWRPQTTGLLQLKVPLGRYQHLDVDKLGTDLLGTGSWDPGVGLNFSKKLKPFYCHADVIGNFPQQVRVNGQKTQYGYYLNYDVAVEYFIPKGFNFMMEFNGLSQGDKTINGQRIPASDSGSLTFAPGLGWSNERIQFLIAYQRVLLGTNVDANDSVVGTFVYTF